MILGVGIDIVSVPRFLKVWKKWGTKFLEKIFTQDEIRYCLFKSCPEEHLAARFAAKESVLKALSEKRFDYALVWKNVEIVKESSGRPNIKLNSKKNLSGFKQDEDILHLSISHCKEYAIAGAIFERKE
ncbi:holo-[acyl-carrier-protein] synthase [bacterium Unc6]|nr:holo-[acyl-carrier-protein] synthase [bacterium Unc6]